MKRIAFVVFLSACACGMIFAQDGRGAGGNPTPPALSTVTGTLGLDDGRFVVKCGNVTYHTRGLERFIGVIDGLKDGVQASIEGYVLKPRKEKANETFLRPVKLTLNGKTYDVGSADNGKNRHPGNGRGAPNGRGSGQFGPPPRPRDE